MQPDEIRLGQYRGYWVAQWRDPEQGTQRRSLRLACTVGRGDALRALEEYRKGVKTQAGKTVGDLMETYFTDKDATAITPARLRYAWKPLEPHFGHLLPEHIDREKCRAYMAARRAKGIQDGTVRKELSCLRAGLRWARPKGADHLFEAIELPPAPPPRDRHLTHAEFRLLLEASNGNQRADAVEDVGNHIRLFIILALTTGGRKEAILQLTWDRVDFERGIIRLGDGTRRVKGRATIPMNDQARTELVKAKKAAMSDHVVEWAGKAIKNVKRGFTSAATKAGLGPDVTPHVLRHTAAVWMVEDGIPMSEVAQYLGHSNTAITERVYARYSPTHLRKASEALKW